MPIHVAVMQPNTSWESLKAFYSGDSDLHLGLRGKGDGEHKHMS